MLLIPFDGTTTPTTIDALADLYPAESAAAKTPGNPPHFYGSGLFRVLTGTKTGNPNFIVWLEASYLDSTGALFWVKVPSTDITLNDVATAYAAQAAFAYLGNFVGLRVNGSSTLLNAANKILLTAQVDVLRGMP